MKPMPTSDADRRPPSSLCMQRAAALGVLMLLLAHPAFARIHGHHHTSAAVHEFKRANACPSTGLRDGPCPGFVVDHVQPLCAGGSDRAENLQWQERTAAREKVREERRQCRRVRHGETPAR
jgi:hypothetical protein